MPNELRLIKQQFGITPSVDETIQYSIEDAEDEIFLALAEAIASKERKSNSSSSKRRNEHPSFKRRGYNKNDQ